MFPEVRRAPTMAVLARPVSASPARQAAARALVACLAPEARLASARRARPDRSATRAVGPRERRTSVALAWEGQTGPPAPSASRAWAAATAIRYPDATARQAH